MEMDGRNGWICTCVTNVHCSAVVWESWGIPDSRSLVRSCKVLAGVLSLVRSCKVLVGVLSDLVRFLQES